MMVRQCGCGCDDARCRRLTFLLFCMVSLLLYLVGCCTALTPDLKHTVDYHGMIRCLPVVHRKCTHNADAHVRAASRRGKGPSKRKGTVVRAEKAPSPGRL